MYKADVEIFAEVMGETDSPVNTFCSFKSVIKSIVYSKFLLTVYLVYSSV